LDALAAPAGRGRRAVGGAREHRREPGGGRRRGRAGAVDRVNGDCLKLTSYFCDRDRTSDAFGADALVALFGREGLATSFLLRGTEGFGEKHVLQTEQVLS